MNERVERIVAELKQLGPRQWICRNPAHGKHEKCLRNNAVVPVRDCWCHNCEQYHRVRPKRPRWPECGEVTRARSSSG